MSHGNQKKKKKTLHRREPSENLTESFVAEPGELRKLVCGIAHGVPKVIIIKILKILKILGVS